MRDIHVSSHIRNGSHIRNYVRHGRAVNPRMRTTKAVLRRIPPKFRFPSQVKDIPNDPGVYAHYNSHDRPLYVGSTKNLRKRIQSYYEDDHTHPTKNHLRPQIEKVGFIEMPLEKARELEKDLKDDTVYNYD